MSEETKAAFNSYRDAMVAFRKAKMGKSSADYKSRAANVRCEAAGTLLQESRDSLAASIFKDAGLSEESAFE